jgi:hypothetical protein
MTDESNFIHSTTLYLGYAVCKEKFYALDVGQEECKGKRKRKKKTKNQMAIPFLPVRESYPVHPGAGKDTLLWSVVDDSRFWPSSMQLKPRVCSVAGTQCPAS